jgi:imidazolonepropionase-like amidohydrolase
MTTIRRATSVAATALGAGERVGTIAVGKQADIIGVRGDPLRHISVLRDPAIVIKEGRRYGR